MILKESQTYPHSHLVQFLWWIQTRQCKEVTLNESSCNEKSLLETGNTICLEVRTSKKQNTTTAKKTTKTTTFFDFMRWNMESNTGHLLSCQCSELCRQPDNVPPALTILTISTQSISYHQPSQSSPYLLSPYHVTATNWEGSWCATETFNTTRVLHIENCEGWRLFSCHSSAVGHCRLKPDVLGLTCNNCWFLY